MCRLLMPLFCVLLLGLPAASRAQPALPEDDFESSDVAKERAKALFESTRATTGDLARARLEAARTQMLERYQKYRQGAQDATLDLLLEAAASLAKAELGALENPTPAERLKPLATHWLYTLSADEIVEAKYRVGRVSLADLMRAKHDRLDAEIKLRESGQKLSDLFLMPLLPLDIDAKKKARNASEAEGADLHDLARRRREAARIAFQVRYEKYQAGAQDATLDLLLKAAVPLLEAESAALEKPTPADRRTFLAACWLYALSAEQIVKAKYRLGRVSLADFAQAQYARLDAEIKLRRADAGKKLLAPFTPALLLGIDTKEMAKSAYEAGQADLHALALARAETARTRIRVLREKIPGAASQDSTLHPQMDAARQLLEAELALHDDPAERLAAHERYWEFAREAENLVHAKYKVGRISLADYAESQYVRLDAEIHMREARAKVKAK